MEPFVSAKDVGAFLNISPRTVTKMAREGRLPAHSVSGNSRRTWRFLLSEIKDTVIMPNRVPAASAQGGTNADAA